MIGLGAFVVGLLLLLATGGLVCAGAALVVRRRLAELSGLPWLLAWSVITTAGVIGVHLIPGALGILSRWTVLVTALLAFGLASRVPARAAAEESNHEASRGADHEAGLVAAVRGEPIWSWVLAIAGLAVFCAFASAHLRASGASAPADVDGLSFHLPGVARWIQTGSFWRITQYLPQQAQGAYPNNGDVVLLAFTLPFRGDVLIRWAMLPYFGLIAIAGYGLARELRAPAPTALLAAVAVIAVPAVTYPALFNVQTDPVMLASFTTGLYFLARHRRTDRRADLVLAGLAMGIAFGTKWYGVSDVVAVIAAWAIAWLLAGRGIRRVASATLLLCGLVAAAGGFWLLRNLVETGNPVFPVKVAPLGVTIFNAPRDIARERFGFTIADYLGSPHILGHFVLPAMWRTLGFTTLLIALVALTAGATAVVRRLRRRAGRSDGTTITLVSGAVMLAIVYAITPYTALGARNQPVQVDANTRYLMPAIVLAAALTASAGSRLGRWRALLEVALLAGIVESVHRSFGLHVSGFVILVALAVGLVAWFRTSLWRWRRYSPALGGVLAAVVLLALLQWHRFSDADYRTDQTIAWILDHAPAGHRIGIAGSWGIYLPPILPAFGPGFGNTVTYVGPVDRHMLEQYSAEAPFVAALQRGRYDLLIVGRGTPPAPRIPAESWARRAGYRQVAQSSELTLFESG